MAGVQGYLHRIQTSRTDDDNGGGAGETRTEAYKVKSGLVLPTVVTRFHDVKSEGGRSTSLPESVGVPISVEGSYPVSGFAYINALTNWAYLGAHPGASSAPTAMGAGATKNEWEWPGTPGVFKSSSMEVLGLLGTSDAAQNRLFRNSIVEEFHVRGSRDNPIEWSSNVRFGGVVTSAGAGTAALTISTTRLLTFGMASCFYNPTAGFSGASPAVTWTTIQSIATVNIVVAAAVDLSAYLQSFDLTFTRRPDVPRSKAPGLVDANGSGIVPDSLDWLEDTNGPDLTAEFVFTSPKTSEQANIAGFQADKEAGTLRGFELLLQDFTTTGTAYLGAKFSFGRLQIIEANEVERGGGTKDLRILCRPVYDTTLGNGAFLSFCNTLGTPGTGITLGG